MQYLIKNVGKGLNTDLPATELEEGAWTSLGNVRVRNGTLEQWDGVRLAATASGPFSWIIPYATPTTRFALYGGSFRAYSWDTAETEITRWTEGAAITSITAVGTLATVTTTTPHGLSNGTGVSHWGAVPVEYNTDNAVTGILVTGPNTYTYTVPGAAPSGPATEVGLSSVNTAIQIFTGAAGNRFTAGTLNGIAIVNSPTDGVFFWNGFSGNKLRRFPNSNKSDVARVFKSYIIQLAPTEGTTKYPHRVSWSASAEPGSIPSSFTASATNDAGFVDIAETAGPMIDCLPLGDVNIVYKQDGKFAQRYIGGNDVFSFTRLPGNDGLLYRGCVVDTPIGHVYLTAEFDLRTHSGGASRSLSYGRVDSFIRSILDGVGATYKNDTFLCVNESKNEVWVCLPAANASTRSCSKVLSWNYKDDTFGVFDAVSTASNDELTCGAWGLYPTSLTTTSLDANCLMLGNNRWMLGNTPTPGVPTSTYFGSTVAWYAERVGMDLGDSARMKCIHSSRWNVTVDGTYTIKHGSSSRQAEATTFGSAITYVTTTTRFADQRTPMDRYVALRIAGAGGNVPTALRSVELNVSLGGTR